MESTAVEAGFQTTPFPISAGAVGRLAAMAVKLKGVSAKTNPSSGRYSVRFQIPGEETGWSASSCAMKCGFQRQKSITSQAESISACCTVLAWPSMVAALRVARHGPLARSAALSSTAARSCGPSAAQSRRAFTAASAASATSAGPAWWKRASTWAWRCGARTSARRPVRTSWPPMTSGISMGVAASSFSLACSAARSGVPGAWVRVGSLRGAGMRKLPLDMRASSGRVAAGRYSRRSAGQTPGGGAGGKPAAGLAHAGAPR